MKNECSAGAVRVCFSIVLPLPSVAVHGRSLKAVSQTWTAALAAQGLLIMYPVSSNTFAPLQGLLYWLGITRLLSGGKTTKWKRRWTHKAWRTQPNSNFFYSPVAIKQQYLIIKKATLIINTKLFIFRHFCLVSGMLFSPYLFWMEFILWHRDRWKIWKHLFPKKKQPSRLAICLPVNWERIRNLYDAGIGGCPPIQSWGSGLWPSLWSAGSWIVT